MWVSLTRCPRRGRGRTIINVHLLLMIIQITNDVLSPNSIPMPQAGLPAAEVLIPDPLNVSRFCVVTNSVSILAVSSSHFSGVDDGEEALRYRGTSDHLSNPFNPPSSILDFSRMSSVSGQAMDPVDTYWKHIPWWPSGNLSASPLMSLASLCEPKRPYASLKW